ncbi:MAG: transposase [Sulfurovum sp.]|nr:transposase [Sulfurovaceae bacterium]
MNATVNKIADKWFISFCIKPSMSYFEPFKNQASVGVDLGIKSLATLSNGSFVDSPKPLKKIADIRKNSLHKLTTALTLKDRIYKCEKCGIEIDRDFNASINIHNQLPIVHRKVTPMESEAWSVKDMLYAIGHIPKATKNLKSLWACLW